MGGETRIGRSAALDGWLALLFSRCLAGRSPGSYEFDFFDTRVIEFDDRRGQILVRQVDRCSHFGRAVSDVDLVRKLCALRHFVRLHDSQ